MKNKTINLLLLFTAVATLFSCEKYSEDTEFTNKEANSTLIIRTRALTQGETDESEISYPINIYLFSENKCIETTTIESEETPISLKLPEGIYDVYAIAGADAETYDLPTKENATKESIINLKADKTHNDLMTAKNNVTLTYGEENTLTLSLERKVMLLENVAIKNVPSNVTAVSVTISPLYENILLNGEYSGTNGSQTIDLTKGSDGTTWENNYNTYLLEAYGQATIKVSLKTDAATKSYSYISTDELKANYKINISGTYNENGITLNGTITGATWEGVKNINFNFDENGSTTDETVTPGTDDGNDEEDTGETVTGNAPEVGTLYNGCYVLKSEQTENGTKVTLMSTTSENELIFTDNDQSSIKEAIDEKIANISTGIDGVEGLRLPTLEELKYIKNNLETVNSNLDKLGKPRFLTNSGTLYSYYYLDNDEIIKTYYPSRDEPDSEYPCVNTNLTSGKKSVLLRAFATITFTE